MPKTQSKTRKAFEGLSTRVSKIVGSPYWFGISLLMVVIWLPSGLIIGFNAIWHLLINTATTILTFLMMSLLHAAQSDWEKKIEIIEARQEKLLKIMEKETEEVIQTLQTDKPSK
ncbi:low affinity iron permease family protein [Candidatus Nomurabacteria bacterium]|uniref:Low affinity iron permease family protein n=1 Tax=candidate division WWE3 bacterium TaxID=2053526 RepID=A0A955IW08_UNCKA|nr:low affinity iron permease family protein [candidate division WWE3 bacterium]MCB9823649.1 low affinity iron permease family protein [Candidatus Nomurabacteria bacterium]MCB9827273.1 low affinity iron permease family protein [Candidatus Nomurabacteria bacterium]MCB9827444.1 low affinity iron permease family protein [Candidatus Nomurabacteria bacterium]HXK52775.1 low affinity iron permease family protein [bacterium]